MTTNERERRIDSYEAAHSKLVEALKTLPKETWTFKPAANKWSVHEIIVHIADAELNSSVRLRTFLAQPGHTVMVYDQDKWAEKMDYHEQSTEDALDAFRLMRRLNSKLLRMAPESAWNNTIDHPENGVMKLTDWLRIYDDHTTKHIGQMQRNYEAYRSRHNVMS